jgi:hypothetical protein
MAQLSTLYNLVICGLAAVLGTGQQGCRPFFKKVSSIWLTTQGFEFDGTQTLDSTYVKLLQAQGSLIILKGVKTFADNTPDDTIEELEDGTKQVARKGQYEFAVQFINGLYFHAALHSLNSQNNFDIIFVDTEGNILGTKSEAGNFKGFTLGMLQASKFMWATDSTAQKEGIAGQLTDRSEFDSDYVFISKDNIDFNPNRLDGINEVLLAWSSAPAAGTSVTVKATLKQGGAAVTGLAFGDFLMTLNGATSNPTADDSEATGDGIYVLTIPAIVADDDITARVYDNSENRGVIDVAGVLFKSNILTATVV